MTAELTAARVHRACRQGRASALVLIVGAALAFTLMGVCVKFASTQYGAGEIVFYRSLAGMALIIGAGVTATLLHDRRSAPGATPTEA